MTKENTPDEIIDALGGTSEVARLCEIRPPSVSEWRRNGIPKAQLRFLRLREPEVFARLEGPLPARRATDLIPTASRPSQPSTTSTAPAGAAAIPTGEMQ